MTVQKVRVPRSSLIYRYDKEFDILDVFIEKIQPTTSDEIYYGIYNYYNRDSDEIIGLSIMDYKKRNKKYIKSLLPFELNFDYINEKIIN